MQGVQEVFEAAWPQLHDESDLPFLIRLLDDVRRTVSGEQLYGVIIHTMQELFYERPIRFLCGATMNAWPGFVPHGASSMKRCAASFRCLPWMSAMPIIWLNVKNTTRPSRH